MLVLHQPRGHGHVVEHAKAASLVGIGVVRAAGQVAGDAPARATSHGHAAGGDGGAHRAACALGHGRAPGKTDFALRGGGQGAGGNGVDIARRVGQGQFAVGRGRRHLQRHAGQVRSHGVAQQAVLGHGKTVPLGQRQHELVCVIGMHDAIVATAAVLGCHL